MIFTRLLPENLILIFFIVFYNINVIDSHRRKFILIFLFIISWTISISIWKERSITIDFIAHVESFFLYQGSIAHLWLIKWLLWLVYLWPINRLRYWRLVKLVLPINFVYPFTQLLLVISMVSLFLFLSLIMHLLSSFHQVP